MDFILYSGRKGLQNALHCTKLLFNPTFQEAIDFKEGMLRNLTSPSQGISRINDTHVPTLEEDFLNSNIRKTIAELKDSNLEHVSCR